MSPDPQRTTAQARNAWIESVLTEHNLEWEVKTIRLASIDIAASKNFQGRPEYLDEDTVNDYGTSMKAGDVFPCPVVCAAAAGKFQILSGNHTCAAYRRIGVTSVDVYFIKRLTSELAHPLVDRLNGGHGLSVPREHRMHRVWFLTALGYDRPFVAKTLGISDGAVSLALKAKAIDERAEKVGVRGFTEVPITTQAMLISDGVSDEVFTALAEATAGLYLDKGPTKGTKTKRVKDLVAQVRKADSDDEAVGLIRKWKEDAQLNRQRVTIRATSMDQLIQGLGKVMKAKVHELVHLTTNPEEREELLERLDEVAERIFEISDAVKTRKYVRNG